MSIKVFKEGFKPHPEIGWDTEKVKLMEDLKEKGSQFVITKLKTEIYNQYDQNVDSKGK